MQQLPIKLSIIYYLIVKLFICYVCFKHETWHLLVSGLHVHQILLYKMFCTVKNTCITASSRSTACFCSAAATQNSCVWCQD